MRIEDQSHGSVAEDGGAGNHLHIAIGVAQVLDHGLMIPEHLVDHEAVMAVLGFDHHDLFALSAGAVSIWKYSLSRM